jgi:hypothetical protein
MNNSKKNVLLLNLVNSYGGCSFFKILSVS